MSFQFYTFDVTSIINRVDWYEEVYNAIKKGVDLCLSMRSIPIMARRLLYTIE